MVKISLNKKREGLRRQTRERETELYAKESQFIYKKVMKEVSNKNVFQFLIGSRSGSLMTSSPRVLINSTPPKINSPKSFQSKIGKRTKFMHSIKLIQGKITK